MSAIMPLHGERIWYKVRHPHFNKALAYRAIGYLAYSETAWSYLVLVNEKGMTYQVQVWRCTALPRNQEQRWIEDGPLARMQTGDEAAFPWAEKPSQRNPDLDTDL